MAVLFSAVTLTADNNQVEFLAAGIPRDADDLEGWTAYENFMDELDSEQEVSVHVEAYLYGEGETFKATPEEVAYFKMRADADEEFLHDHCDNIEDTDFTIQWSPDELYGVELDVPFPVSWTVKMKKKQKETQDILSYHTQAAGCSDKARAKASGGRQPIEECGRTGL